MHAATRQVLVFVTHLLVGPERELARRIAGRRRRLAPLPVAASCAHLNLLRRLAHLNVSKASYHQPG